MMVAKGGRAVSRAGLRQVAWGVVLVLLTLMLVPTSLADDGLYTIRERFGVNVALQFSGVPDFPGHLSDYPSAEDLGFGWYSDWTTQLGPECPEGVEFAQLIHTRPWPPDWENLAAVVEANPSALWIVGNEPETRGQGQHTPEEYAVIYHEAYAFLKEHDASAQVAIGGVVMPTPLRLRWLELCFESYRDHYNAEMPIDVWNIHVQILQELRYGWGCGIPYGLDDDAGRLYEIVDNCDGDIFEQLVYEFCVWLEENGQRDKPVIISEYGVLMPSSYLPHGDDDVLAFMEHTFDYMLMARDSELGYGADGDRLVQRWMWFSLNFPSYDDTEGGFNGALCDWRHPDQLTVFGEFFRDYVHSVDFGAAELPLVVDTYVDPLRALDAMSGQGRIKLRADVSGNSTAALVGFDLGAMPSSAVIGNATLGIQVAARTNAQPLRVSVAPARCDWDESATYSSWDTCVAPVRPELELELGDCGSYEIDLTDLVTRWHAGIIPNQGLLFDVASADNRGNVTYDLCSSEWVEGPQSGPTLHVEYLFRE